MRAIIFFCAITVIVLVAIVFLLRSGKLKEKYAILWAVIGLTCLALAAFPRLLTAIANLVGIAVPSNLLFTLAILLLLGICLQLSLEISGQEEKVRRLAEEVAILRAAIEPQLAGTPGTDPAGDHPQPDAALPGSLSHPDEVS